MDRTKTIDEHSKALRHIVAVLLALADLAERASGRSPVVRALVLWLLRSGEVLALDYVAHATGQSCTAALLADDGACEALRLATSFRRLAAALTALAAESLGSLPHATSPKWSTLAASAPLAASPILTLAVGRRDSS